MHFRTLGLIGGLAAVIALAGCGSQTDTTNNTEPGTTTTTVPSEPTGALMPADLNWTAGAHLARYQVDNIDCQGCIEAIAGAVAKVGGVSDAKGVLSGREVFVVFDPAKTTTDAIAKVIDATPNMMGKDAPAYHAHLAELKTEKPSGT